MTYRIIMKISKIAIALSFLLSTLTMSAQETLPVYSDYLSDNVYLVHPAAAGIGNCGKIRFTARAQWLGESDAPALQTLSFQTRIGEKGGIGAVLFNDKNGYHSQQGILGTYAYHIDLGRADEAHQLSFGLSLMAVQNSVDESNFHFSYFDPAGNPEIDPAISYVVSSRNYFNSDVGIAYHKDGLFSYLTAKNLLLAARNLYNDDYESLNLRRYLFTLGYYFGEDYPFQFEPSIMGQYVESTKEKFMDFNMKVYKKFDESQIWLAGSYRRAFEGNNPEDLQYITGIFGVNYRKFLFSYTYTYQYNDVVFDNGGYHQITLGYNFGCREPRATGCPNINAMF